MDPAGIEAHLDQVTCPSCGGAGGGPFGRAGSAWDDEEFVCPRCEGVGILVRAVPEADDAEGEGTPSVRPGIVKTTPVVETPARKKRKASA